MRLINTRTLELKEFLESDLPKYAILSHTWGNEEVTLQQFLDASTSCPRNRHLKGYRKVQSFCRESLKDGFEWAWADTCCIDKANPTELSEAINSMYAWYQDSERCYVYLSDLSGTWDIPVPSSVLHTMLESCSWFTRGWTLQEMIAPTEAVFFDQSWRYIGTRTELAQYISDITNVDVQLLKNKKGLSRFSCAQKLSWAAGRQTTRIEDRSYSLLGIFGITLSLRYGEGHGAFQRLQEAIMFRSSDQSLFAWTLEGGKEFYSHNPFETLNPYCILAPSPDCFHNSSNIIPYEAKDWQNFWSHYAAKYCRRSYYNPRRCLGTSGFLSSVNSEPYMMTNMGLQIKFPAVSVVVVMQSLLQEAALYCYDETRPEAGPRTICLVKNLVDEKTHRAEPHYLGYATNHPLHKHYHWDVQSFVIQSLQIKPETVTKSQLKNNIREVNEWKRRTLSRIQKARLHAEQVAELDEKEQRDEIRRKEEERAKKKRIGKLKRQERQLSRFPFW
jgi:hypothetical protein